MRQTCDRTRARVSVGAACAWVLLTTIFLVSSSASSAHNESRGPMPERWLWPIAEPHPVVQPYRPPDTRYTAGHRGIDIATTIGQPVMSTSDGTITFAGIVVDRPVLTVEVSPQVRWSIEPVVAQRVAGSVVRRGETLGTVSAGGHCENHCVHFGVRVDGNYISPFRFLGRPQRAVLLPLTLEDAHSGNSR